MSEHPDQPDQQASARDFEPDVEQLHRQILREPIDPVEGREPPPLWLWVVAVGAIFWAGLYLGRRGGTFDTATHIAYSQRTGTTPSTGSQENGRVVPTDMVALGKQVFAKNCQACHQASGLGMPGVFPPLIGSQWVIGSEQVLVRIILDGLHEPIEVHGTTFNGVMPSWRAVLKDDEIAAVATYIRQWSPNSAPPVTMATVAEARAATSSRGKPWTVSELSSVPSSAVQKTQTPANGPAGRPRR